MNGITYIKDFLSGADDLFTYLQTAANWDESMAARKTASYGVAYNYSQISYPFKEMPLVLEKICLNIKESIGFQPNNCLINYYLNGNSKMGYHSDQIDILEDNTGVVIVSLGETRVLRFREIDNIENIIDYDLPSGSLIYMTQEVQTLWQHSIPKADTNHGRMSLTFRKMKQ